MQGVVKMYRASGTGGWGFIGVSDSGYSGDIFVHHSEVTRIGFLDLEPGQGVNFSIQTNPRTGKPCATDLELLEPIISPRRADHEQHLAHMELAQITFMRRAK